MTRKAMIQAKARALAVDLILANSPSSVEMYRRGLTTVHGAAVVDALEEELAHVRQVLQAIKAPSQQGRAPAKLGKKRINA
jgi:hypothetical protein